MSNQIINSGRSGSYSQVIWGKIRDVVVGGDKIPAGLWKFVPIYVKQPAGLVSNGEYRIYDSDGVKIWEYVRGTDAGYVFFYSEEWLYIYPSFTEFFIYSDGNAYVQTTQALCYFDYLLLRVL